MNVLRAGFVMQMKLVALTPLSVILAALTPLTVGLIAISRIGHPDTALVVGVAAAGVWDSLLFQCLMASLQERGFGTLPLLVGAPRPLVLPMAGRLLAGAFQALVAFPLTWGFIYAVWGDLPLGHFWLTTGAIGVMLVGFAGMAVFVMGLLARFRFFAGMTNGLFQAVVVLAGLLVPLAQIPASGVFSRILGPAYAMEALRTGDAGQLAAGALVSLVWLALGLLYLHRAEAAMRRNTSAFHN